MGGGGDSGLLGRNKEVAQALADGVGDGAGVAGGDEDAEDDQAEADEFEDRKGRGGAEVRLNGVGSAGKIDDLAVKL